MDGDPIELLGILFFAIYIIVKPIICYHYIKLNNNIFEKGILGEATLLEVKKISLRRIPPDYNYTIQFYLNDKRVRISSRMSLHSSPGKPNDLIQIKHWEGYPYDVYICNFNYKYTYIIWSIKVIFVSILLIIEIIRIISL